MAKRALVTGATGFIGGHLVGRLEAAGWTVAKLGRVSETAAVIDAVKEAEPDVVFHLASLFLASHTAEQVGPLIAANVLFGAQLLEAMAQTECKVLVNAGTGWQNYTPEPPFDAPGYRPVNLYAATKQAFEDVAQYYVETSGLRMVTLRLFDSYGPGDSRRKLLRLLLQALRTGETLGMSPGDQMMDLVHVDDICGAFLRAAELGLAMDAGAAVYAVSGGERRTLRQVAATLAEAAGRELPVEFGKRAHRVREVMHPWDGPGVPGWTARISLLEGFRNLLAAEGLGIRDGMGSKMRR